jgi:hypothetical protein
MFLSVKHWIVVIEPAIPPVPHFDCLVIASHASRAFLECTVETCGFRESSV